MIKERKKQTVLTVHALKVVRGLMVTILADVDVISTILSMMEVKSLLSATIVGKTLQ